MTKSESFFPACNYRRTVAGRLEWMAGIAAWMLLFTGKPGWTEVGVPPQEPRPAIQVREIFVPETEWAALLESRPERIFLSRLEYEELLAKARREPRPQAAPRAWALTDSLYEIRLDRDRAWIQGTLHLRLLAEGLQIIPLPLRGAAVHMARLDDHPAAISLLRDNDVPSAIELFAEGVGAHTFAFTAAAALEISSVQQSLKIRLPQAASRRVVAVVPGDVELKSGAVIMERRFDSDGATRFDLLLPDEEATLVFTLNSRLRRNRRLVHARSVSVVETTEAAQRICGEIAFDILDQPLTSLEVAIPKDFEVTAVDCPAAIKWEERLVQDRRELAITLREPVAGLITVRLQGVRSEGVEGEGGGKEESDFPLVLFQPLGVTSHSAVVSLLLGSNLRLESLSEANVVRLDGSGVKAVIDSLVEATGLPSRSRLVGAWYAPWGNPVVSARAARPRPQLDAWINLVLTVNESELSLLGEAFLTPLEEKLYEVVLLRPADWHVARMTLADGTPVRFESFGALDEPGRLVVLLPEGIEVGSQTRIDFQAVRTMPVQTWDEPNDIAFPNVRVASATRERAAMALTAATDLEVRPIQLERLVPLNKADRKEFGLSAVDTALAYRVIEQPFAARFQVVKKQPRMNAELFQCFRLETVALHAHIELVYRVEGARSDTFVFSLPLNTPEEIPLTCGEGRGIKQITHEARGDRRYWTVRLQEPVLGRVRLIAEWWQERQVNSNDEMPLPLAICSGVVYQTGLVSLEATSELEVDLLGEARRVDEGELAAAQYQPGPGLLAVLSYGGDAPPLTARARHHELLETPTVLVQRATMRTQLDSNGASVSQADFLLRTGGASLHLNLPRASELWSVMLDGRPLRVTRDGMAFRIEIPAGQTQATRHLRVVYGQHVPAFGLVGSTNLESLWLSVPSSRGTSGELSCADLQWNILLPPGFTVLRSQGNVLRLQQQPEPLILRVLNFFRLLQMDFGCGIQAARESRHSIMALRPGAEIQSEEMEPGQPAVDIADSPTAEMGQVANQPMAEGEGARRAEGPNAAQLPAATAPIPQRPESGKAQALEARGRAAVKRRMQAGFGPLPVELQVPEGYEVVSLSNLGDQPTVRLTVAAERDVLYFAALLLGGVIAVLVNTRASRNGKFAHGSLLTLLAVASLLPLIPGAEALQSGCNSFFVGVCGGWLGFYLVPPLAAALGAVTAGLVGAYRWLHRVRTGSRTRFPTANANVGILIAIALTLFGPPGFEVRDAFAQGASEARGAAVATDSAERWTVRVLDAEPPLKLPDDAIIIPYDPSQGWESPWRRAWIPLAKYLELWKAVQGDGADEGLPSRPFASGSVSYEGTLGSEDVLRLHGSFDVLVYVSKAVPIPVLISNAMPVAVRVDGQPASLEPGNDSGVLTDSTGTASAAARQQQVAGASNVPTAMALYVSGKGVHRVEIDLLIPLARTGGWRTANAVLPCPAPGRVILRVPQSGSEVLFPAGTGRLKSITTEPDASVEASLLPPGNFSIQWRPQVIEAAVDRALSVQSMIVVDAREDFLLCHWDASLRFRQGERQSFEFVVPTDWEVEQIEGENVKSWDATQTADVRHVTVTLLAAAHGEERIVLHLRRSLLSASTKEADFEIPLLAVPGAVSHAGQIIVRRSPCLELTVMNAASLRAIPNLDPASYRDAVRDVPSNPLGLLPFATFAFVAQGDRPQIHVRVLESQQTADVQAIFRVAAFRQSLESRIIWHVDKQPFYRGTILLPAKIHRIDQVELPGEGSWNIEAAEGASRLNIFWKDGQLGDVSVIVRATLSVDDTPSQILLPTVGVDGVRAVRGELAISVEPRYSIELKSSRDCQPVLVSRLSWLPADQRDSISLALEYADALPEAAIVLHARTPLVTCETIGNVRFTDRVVEETLLLDFSVAQAGIHRLRFRLPPQMRDCRIQAPMLRSKSLVPCQNQPESDFWVDIEFQDAVMGELRILIEQDFALTASPHRVCVPTEITVPDGPPIRVGLQAVTLQNAGRDEVVVVESQEVEQAGSQGRSQLEDRLRGPDGLAMRVTEAYVVAAGAKHPRLAFQTRPRAAQRGGGIRIRMADGLLVLDGKGVYRGEQRYWVENREEQFLRIRLPEGARLWSASVDGRPAKPVADEQATEPFWIRLPVSRTAEGDLPLRVIVKYGGTRWPIGWLRRFPLPLPCTPDWIPEWSQVRVYSADDRWLFDFAGTARKVPEQDLASGYDGFRQKLASDLTETFKQGDEYARVRAGWNLRILGGESGGLLSVPYELETEIGGGYEGSRHLGWGEAAEEISQALEQVESSAKAGRGLNNRVLLGSLYEKQRAVSVREATPDRIAAFQGGVPPADKKSPPKDSPDRSWYRGLEERLRSGRNGQPEQKLAENQQMPAGLPPAATPARQLQSRFEAAAGPEADLLERRKGTAKGETSIIDGVAPKEESSLGLEIAEDTARRYSDRYQKRQRSAIQSDELPGETFEGVPTQGNQAEPGQGPRAGAVAKMPDTKSSVEGADTPAEGPAVGLDGGRPTLDVDIPTRGRLYCFVAPQGEIEIQARSIPAETTSRLSKAAVAGVMIAGLAVFLAVLTRCWQYLTRHRERAFAVSAVALLLVCFTGPLGLLFLLISFYALAAGMTGRRPALTPLGKQV